MRYAPNLMRSRVEPQTIASETAQKANWKRNLEPFDASENDIAGRLMLAVCCRKKPSGPPANQPVVPPSAGPEPPKASAKPIAQYMSAAIEKLATIFAAMVPTFFWREKPTSSSRNPACIRSTRMPAMSTHIVSSCALSVALLTAGMRFIQRVLSYRGEFCADMRAGGRRRTGIVENQRRKVFSRPYRIRPAPLVHVYKPCLSPP